MNLLARKVLVLDGELRSSLAVTRSLGRRHAMVVVAAATADCLAGASKYAAACEVYTSPQMSELGFIADIERLCSQYKITDLLPLSEVALAIVLRHRERFVGISLPYVDLQTYNFVVDKHQLMQLADSLDIHTPKSIYCENAEDIIGKIENVVYPAVLKPAKSRVFFNGCWLHTQVQYAFDEAELLEKIATQAQFKHPFMIQQYIGGEGKGVFFLYCRGRQQAYFSHRRLREKPPSGGVSVLSQSEHASPNLKALAERLLDKLNWHGVAMVEFKVTAEGVPYLMEINPRFWGSLQLAIDSGVDFPYLLLAMEDAPAGPVQGFKEGVRLRWLLGDFDHLVIVMRSSAYTVAQKMSALLSFLNFFSLRTRYETLRMGDMRPFFRELKLYFMDLVSASRRNK